MAQTQTQNVVGRECSHIIIKQKKRKKKNGAPGGISHKAETDETCDFNYDSFITVNSFLESL